MVIDTTIASFSKSTRIYWWYLTAKRHIPLAIHGCNPCLLMRVCACVCAIAILNLTLTATQEETSVPLVLITVYIILVSYSFINSLHLIEVLVPAVEIVRVCCLKKSYNEYIKWNGTCFIIQHIMVKALQVASYLALRDRLPRLWMICQRYIVLSKTSMHY